MGLLPDKNEAVMSDEILIIDSDRAHSQALAPFIGRRQFNLSITESMEEALPLFDMLGPHFTLMVDPMHLETDAVDLLQRYKATHSSTQIIIISPEENLSSVMEKMGLDAICYLEKPVNSIALNLALKQAQNQIEITNNLRHCTQKINSLQETQTLYEQLFDEVPCYITVQDRQFRITATNRLFKEHFGTEIGSYCYEIYKHRSTQCAHCPVADTFVTGIPNRTEEVVTAKSGQKYNVLTWTAPIRDADGEIAQVMEMSTDITHIRQLQDHLTSLGLMIGSMSHGIKGMLTALDGGIYQLETGLKKNDDERVDRAFGQVRQMADRIRKMVLEILYYAKSRKLQYQTVDVGQVLRRVVEAAIPKANQNQIPFETDISDNLGQCEVDPNWFEAALVNFLENAIEACTHDRSRSDHQVLFSARPLEGNRICFEVEDNGMGMDQETREKMFTLFFSSKGSQGTGLGMFIAHHVITQHGGEIQVSSEPGKGAHFTICIPRERPVKIPLAELNGNPLESK